MARMDEKKTKAQKLTEWCQQGSRMSLQGSMDNEQCGEDKGVIWEMEERVGITMGSRLKKLIV